MLFFFPRDIADRKKKISTPIYVARHIPDSIGLLVIVIQKWKTSIRIAANPIRVLLDFIHLVYHKLFKQVNVTYTQIKRTFFEFSVKFDDRMF